LIHPRTGRGRRLDRRARSGLRAYRRTYAGASASGLLADAGGGSAALTTTTVHRACSRQARTTGPADPHTWWSSKSADITTSPSSP